MGVSGQRHAPAALPPERPGTYCITGLVGPRTSLDGCGKSRLHRYSVPGPSSLQRVAIPTDRSQPTVVVVSSIENLAITALSGNDIPTGGWANSLGATVHRDEVTDFLKAVSHTEMEWVVAEKINRAEACLYKFPWGLLIYLLHGAEFFLRS